LRGRATEIEVEFPFAHLISFRDGKATKVRMYTNEAAALEAAGLAA
jgi:ketosteroid isomerase-like protein